MFSSDKLAIIAEQVSTQSEELTKFYRWWWERANNTTERDFYISEIGLCFLGYGKSVRQEIINQFRDVFNTSHIYPFGEREYRERKLGRSMHLCPKRREWVRLHIPELCTEV